MKPFGKIQAGALQFVVFIGVVIAILLGTFVTLVYVNAKFAKQTDLVLKTIENANKGIFKSLIETHPHRDTIDLSVPDGDLGTLKLYKSFWGVYETATTVSTIKKNRIVNHAFIGGNSKLRERTGLYLADDNQPLVVVGNTYIDGRNFIPSQGLKAGTIAGVSYHGNQLLYGTSTTSSENLPQLDANIISEVKSVQNLLDSPLKTSVIAFDGSKPLKHSFKEEAIVLYDSENINLINIEFIGQIIVFSDKKITVNPTSTLNDVILIAPEIVIQSDFNGNLQAIASESILVEDNVFLEYPSALILQNEEENPSEDKLRHIQISENSTINGQVIVNLPVDDKARFEPQLKLATNTMVAGEVYCNQNVEHLGAVEGSLYARRFVARQAGSVYINHIYNGRIDAKALSEDYVGLNFSNTSTKGIIKWGY